MRLIILLGAPGSGKGTTAERVRDAAGYQHVSTGDMLREAVKNGTDVGQEADGYMKRGELVPDAVMIRIIEDLFDSGDADASYMLDGFPRTIAQAELLEQGVAKRVGDGAGGISHVFFLDAPREVLIRRLVGRRICRQCGAGFHVEGMKPKKEGICDHCGGELYQRPDDCEETISNRLDVFNKQTESLISRYEKQGILVRVDSNQNADSLAAELIKTLASDE